MKEKKQEDIDYNDFIVVYRDENDLLHPIMIDKDKLEQMQVLVKLAVNNCTIITNEVVGDLTDLLIKMSAKGS